MLHRDYHEGEESSIDNERGAVSDSVISEASFQTRPNSIRSSNQGSLLDPSPPYALSLHEYQTDHDYSATTERIQETTQSIVLSGGGKPLVLRIYVMESRNLIATENFGSRRTSSVIQIGLMGRLKQEVSLNLHREIYVDLPLVGMWVLRCVCWQITTSRKDLVGVFEIPIGTIFTSGRVREQPQWYTLEEQSWSGETKQQELAGEVKLRFTLLSSDDDAALSADDSYENIRKLTQATV